ncbi:uncharacterized protein LOC125575223 isoform X1 [Brassica napus]|uniref:uncharacterized protein LOC125575223 isoform X1 n=1 Tax=Brassica napus TaxID=3708 RepID=UPI0020792536|nr:uncharacterized protein LOC125575223 isoform X1 [Brassica napus]
MTLKSSPSGIFIAAPVLRSTGVHLGEKIVSLILWAIKLFELTMGAHIIWRLKKVLKYLCFCSNSALILWKIVSCAALRTSKRGMAVATHAELLAAEGTSVMKENVTHETSQSDQNSKGIIL